jgi:hypothetical protein
MLNYASPETTKNGSSVMMANSKFGDNAGDCRRTLSRFQSTDKQRQQRNDDKAHACYLL